MSATYLGNMFQERGNRKRIFTVVSDHPQHATLTFTGGSWRRGETRTVEILHDTLRKRFVLISPA